MNLLQDVDQEQFEYSKATRIVYLVWMKMVNLQLGIMKKQIRQDQLMTIRNKCAFYNRRDPEHYIYGGLLL